MSIGAGDLPSLPEENDDLELDHLLQETWIDRVHYFDQVDSTNSAALAHAAGGDPALAELFVAERQTAGRGRGSNQWWSGAGALTWTVLTRALPVPPPQLPRTSLTMGLAICTAVEQHLPQADVALKWPNDVYLGRRKLAGILIELPAAAPGRLAIGVGLNVNNRTLHAPAEIRQSATSLLDAAPTGHAPFHRTAVLQTCLQSMERELDRFLADDPTLHADWQARCLLSGRDVRLATPQWEVAGRCEGIAADGALEIRTPTGTQACHGGVVLEFT